VGSVINKFKMASTSPWRSPTRRFTVRAQPTKHRRRCPLDGSMCCAQACPTPTLPTDDVVARLQGTRRCQRFFPHLNTEQDGGPPPPPGRRAARRVSCACCRYYLGWHMKQDLARSWFATTTNPPPGQAHRPGRRGRNVQPHAGQGIPQAPGRLPVHSFTSLLARSGHHLRQPHPPTTTCPLSPSSTTAHPAAAAGGGGGRGAFDCLSSPIASKGVVSNPTGWIAKSARSTHQPLQQTRGTSD